MITKTKVHYNLEIIKVGTVGPYEIGTNKPYTYKMGSVFKVNSLKTVKKKGFEIGPCDGITYFIPYEYFKVTEVTTTTKVFEKIKIVK